MAEGFYVGDLDELSPFCLQFLLRYFKRQLDNQFPFVTRQCRWEEKERGDCILREEDTVDEALLLVTGRLRSTHKHLRDGSKYKLQYRLSYDGGRCFSEREKDEMTRKMQVKSSEEMVSGWDGSGVVNSGVRGVAIAGQGVAIATQGMPTISQDIPTINASMPTIHRDEQDNAKTIPNHRPNATPDEVVVSVSNERPPQSIGVRRRHSSLCEPLHQRGKGHRQSLLQ